MPSRYLSIIILSALLPFLMQKRGVSQVIPDQTLGSESSNVTPINANFDRIDGGAVRGSHLFHSFSQFNIPDSHSVYFSNPAVIQTIFSRVTGNTPSEIMGRLGVLGDANLVFMNPHGVIFGQNASLDISGSFVVTTAETIRFPDGSQFSAVNPQGVPILTIDVPVPVGLVFEGDPTGKIYNQGDLAVGGHLSLISGEIINLGSLNAINGKIELDTVGLSDSPLVSGDIKIVGNSEQVSLLGDSAEITAGNDLIIQDAKVGTIEDLSLTAQDSVMIRDSVLTPTQIVAGRDLTIQGNQAVDIFALNHPQSGLFSGGDMVLISLDKVGGDAHYYSGGTFRIEKLDGNLGDLNSPYDPVIRSQGDVEFSGYQGTSLHIIAGGAVNIDTVIITGSDTVGDSINPTATPDLANVTLSDGTAIVIDGNAQPTLDIRAGVDPDVIGLPLGTTGYNFPSEIFIPLLLPPNNNEIATSADITLSDVFMRAPNGLVFITNKYRPNTALSGGNIVISGGVGIVSNDEIGGFEGDASDIIIDGINNINLLENSSISSSSVSGLGGDIKLLADGDLNFTPNSLILSTGELGGLIKLKGQQITVQESIISTISTGEFEGNVQSGDIKIEAETININQGIVLASSVGGNAQAGDIEIDAKELKLENLGIISSLSFSQGNTGNITLNIEGEIQLLGGNEAEDSGNNSGFFDQISSLSSASSIQVGTFDDAQINGADTNGEEIEADTGNINIFADSLLIEDISSIGNFNDVIGDTGQISLVVNQGITLKSGLIINSLQNEGQGGDINIETGFIEILEGGQIGTGVARSRLSIGRGNSVSGGAGDININATNYIKMSGTLPDFLISNPSNLSDTFSGEGTASVITTATNENTFGTSGSISINTPTLQVTNGAAIETYTVTSNPAGNMILNVDVLELTQGGQLISTTLDQGNAGAIELNIEDKLLIEGFDPTFAERLEKFGSDIVTNQGAESGIFANTTSESTGNGGNITITDSNQILIKDQGRIIVESSGLGKPGTINIKTDILTIGQDAQLSATATSTSSNTEGEGSINLNANILNISGKLGIFAETNSVTPAGSLTINPKNTSNLMINFTEEGFISASTTAQGEGGNIKITAPQTLDISGEGTISVTTSGKGNAGIIELNSQQLNLSDGLEISASTTGDGKAGDIFLIANTLNLDNTQLNAFTDSQGIAGNIVISDQDNTNADQVSLTNQSIISTEIKLDSILPNNHPLSNILIQTDSLTLDNSTLTTSTAGIGDAGDITIPSATNITLNNSNINASTSGEGDTGEIEISASDTLQLNN
ncbi:MAG: filamentous hemagglutinin N-terminal domain-containing protein, partial [Microcystaceae cyanobacterium]